MLMEGNTEFEETHGCVVTPVVVQVIGKVTTQIKIMNPTSTDVQIRGDAVLGTLCPVVVEHELLRNKMEDNPTTGKSPLGKHRCQRCRRCQIT